MSPAEHGIVRFFWVVTIGWMNGQEQFSFSIHSTNLNLLVSEFYCENFGLAENYHFKLTLFSTSRLSLESLVNQTATINFPKNKKINGIITQAIDKDNHFYEVELQSPLYPLQTKNNSRCFLNQTVPDVIKAILLEHGFKQQNIEQRLTNKYPKQPLIMQLDESDWQFYSRLNESSGMFYFFDLDKLIMTDDLNEIENGTIKKLRFQFQIGLVSDEYSAFELCCESALLPESIFMRKNGRDHIERAGSNVPSYGEDYRYGEFFKTRMHSYDWQRKKIIITTDCPLMIPGQVLRLYNSPKGVYDLTYRVIAIQHELNAMGCYKNQITLIPENVPYAPAIKTQLPKATLQIATIESTHSDKTFLDEQGRYHLRFAFDKSNRPPGQASPPISLLQPYTGSQYGLHFPLRHGTKVLVSFINNDVNRPVILGAIPDGTNSLDNFISTPNGSTLLMSDKHDQEHISLYTPKHEQELKLDAQHEKISMRSEKGKMLLHTGQDLHSESAKTIYKTKGDYDVRVNKNYSVNTQEGEFAIQCGTFYGASENDINIRSNNVTISGKQVLRFEAGECLNVSALQGGITLNANNDIIHLQANQDINLSSTTGNISISTPAASLTLSSDGQITLSGTRIEVCGACPRLLELLTY